MKLLMALGFLGLAAEASGQGVGFTGGAAVDPSQGYVGSYLESAQIANHIRLRAGIDRRVS